jgi:hypothetical protein
VGLFTTNPTKLSLQFSDFSTIFYTIYKKQQKHFTISVANCSQALEKIFFFAMWFSGRAAAVRR